MANTHSSYFTALLVTVDNNEVSSDNWPEQLASFENENTKRFRGQSDRIMSGFIKLIDSVPSHAQPIEII